MQGSRFLRTGGCRWGPALLFALAVPCAAQETVLPSLPQEAEGQIHFFADGALLLDHNGDPEVYFSLAVPEGELQCIEREEESGRWLELMLSVRSLGSGDRQLLRQGRRLDVPCADVAAERDGPTDADPFARRLLYLQVPQQRGTTHFEVSIEDRNASRVGLVHQLRSERNEGRVRGRLEASGLRAGRGLSGIIFLWSLPRHGELRGAGGFWLAPADSVRPWIEPNPSRSYGLLNPTLRFFVEAYQLAAGEGELVLRLFAAHDDRPLEQRAASLTLPDPRSSVIGVLDLSALPAGTYTLELEFTPWGETIQPFRTRGRFHLLWDPASWSRSQAQLLSEVAVILPEASRQHFASLEAGEREAYMESLWVALGDLPLEGLAPTQARFRDRIGTANARFGWGQRRGAETDRGRIFIRYGQPDEIHKELIPQWKDQLYYFMRDQVDDLESPGINPRARIGWDEDDPAGGSERLPRIHWLDDAAYEVWSYIGAGEPLIPAWAPPTCGRPVEFIFVDRLGIGDYRLVYTNVFGGY